MTMGLDVAVTLVDATAAIDSISNSLFVTDNILWDSNSVWALSHQT